MKNGTYKLSNDYMTSRYTDITPRLVREIVFHPSDERLPCVGICRVYSSRADAEKILVALHRDDI